LHNEHKTTLSFYNIQTNHLVCYKLRTFLAESNWWGHIAHQQINIRVFYSSPERTVQRLRLFITNTIKYLRYNARSDCRKVCNMSVYIRGQRFSACAKLFYKSNIKRLLVSIYCDKKCILEALEKSEKLLSCSPTFIAFTARPFHIYSLQIRRTNQKRFGRHVQYVMIIRLYCECIEKNIAYLCCSLVKLDKKLINMI
jgi:hypothetical protein